MSYLLIARQKQKSRFPTQPLLTLGRESFSLLLGRGWDSVTLQVLDSHMWLVTTILDNTCKTLLLPFQEDWRQGGELGPIKIEVWGQILGHRQNKTRTQLLEMKSMAGDWFQNLKCYEYQRSMDTRNSAGQYEPSRVGRNYTIILTKFLPLNPCKRGGVSCYRFLYHSVWLK